MKKQIFTIFIGLVGFGLIVYGTNWQAALGLFLALWGNNMDRTNSTKTEVK